MFHVIKAIYVMQYMQIIKRQHTCINCVFDALLFKGVKVNFFMIEF